ncbi:MAG: hydroxymethylpyrimidine/phosphomethylpyrimidine kinase [Betaproteobacteria bacterium]
MSSTPPIVLAFASSDPTGGAGLQADLLSIAALGCHPLSVLTGLTVQDTRGVESLFAIEPEWVEQQARRVLEDITVAAFKLGVLGSARNAEVVAAILAAHPDIPVVLDPVLASGRGDALADNETMKVMRSALLPLTTVLTPNSPEARRLAEAAPDADLPGCAGKLAKLGCKYVLVTGTHESGAEVVNTLYDARGKVREDRWQRLPGSFHGSGCTLAAALAALLARGLSVERAIQQAQEFTWKSLAAGFSPGRGQSIPDRFFGSR